MEKKEFLKSEGDLLNTGANPLFSEEPKAANTLKRGHFELSLLTY